MNRKLLVPTLVAAAALLAGCATGYQYREGTGDYYYGQPSVEYRDWGYDGYGYGYPYGGGWSGSLGFGYGYGSYPYWGYGYPFYGYPYYYRGHGHDHDHGHGHHHRGGHDEPDGDDQDPPMTPPSPQVGNVRPPHAPLLPGRTRTPTLVREPSILAPRLSTPMPPRALLSPPPAPRMDPPPRLAPRDDDRPRMQAPIRMGEDRDSRRKSDR